MRSFSKVTPEGTRDLLFEECRTLRGIRQRLSKLFSLRGYREAATPGLEFFDVFCLPGAAIPQQEMYKSTDNAGRILAFRPDSTLPIARMAASRLQGEDKPLRLFYDQAIYRNRPDFSGRNDESPQMGVELLGASGLKADLEVIATAVEALSLCTGDFRLEIGHAGLFRALSDRLPLSPEQREEVRSTIEAKNYAALSELLDPLGDDPTAQAVKRLPRLFGGEEVFQEAESWPLAEEGKDILRELQALYRGLRKLGLGDRLMVDLGLVQRNDYYTGVVFSAYVRDYGETVLMGGRYDKLCEKFGEPMAAVGFSLDLEATASLMDPLPETTPRVLVFGEDGWEAEVQKKVRELTLGDVPCEAWLGNSLEECRIYAKKRGIPQMVIVGKNGEDRETL